MTATTDLLLKFPSKERAVEVGIALGVTSPSDEEPGLYDTIQADHETAVCVIGEHMIPTGNTTIDEFGNEIQELVGDGAWWVMVRAMEANKPTPPELEPYVVAPNESDPSIPNRKWA